MNKPERRPLLLHDTAIVRLRRGQVVKVGGLPLELLADDVEFKTAAENVRLLGGRCQVVEYLAEE